MLDKNNNDMIKREILKYLVGIKWGKKKDFITSGWRTKCISYT